MGFWEDLQNNATIHNGSEWWKALIPGVGLYNAVNAGVNALGNWTNQLQANANLENQYKQTMLNNSMAAAGKVMGMGPTQTDPKSWGVPGAAGYNSQIQDYLTRMQQQSVNPDFSASNMSRDQQMQLIQQLQDQAAGRAPSLAEATLNNASNQNMQQALAMAAQQRGVGGAAAMRDVGQQRANIGQQTAADAGMLRLNEQMQARNQMGGMINAMRGNDLNQAQLGAQTQLQQNQQQNQGFAAMMQQLMALAQLQQQGNIDMNQFNGQQNLGWGTLFGNMSVGQGTNGMQMNENQFNHGMNLIDRGTKALGTFASAGAGG